MFSMYLKTVQRILEKCSIYIFTFVHLIGISKFLFIFPIIVHVLKVCSNFKNCSWFEKGFRVCQIFVQDFQFFVLEFLELFVNFQKLSCTLSSCAACKLLELISWTGLVIKFLSGTSRVRALGRAGYVSPYFPALELPTFKWAGPYTALRVFPFSYFTIFMYLKKYFTFLFIFPK